MTDTSSPSSPVATPQQSLGTTLTNNLYPANTYLTQPAPTGAEAQAILDSILGPGGQAFGPSKVDALPNISTNMAIPGAANISTDIPTMIPHLLNVPTPTPQPVQAQSYSSPFYNPVATPQPTVPQAQTGSLGANPFAIFQNQGNVAPLFQNVTGVTPSGLTEEEEAERLLEELEELMWQYGDEF